jgi:cell volume regulation protein A
VWLCLLPFRFSWRETAFISWVGLRGAVSIFLASIPMLTGLPDAELYFNVAFFVVLVSLLVQGWTTLPGARWLAVALPRVRHQVRRVELDLPGELGYEMVGYPVPPDSPILHQARIPDWARLVFVVRDHRVVTPAQAGVLQVGDHVYFVVSPSRVQILDHLFAPPDEIDEADRDFFGEFTFEGDLQLGSLATLYGIEVPPEAAGRSLAEHFARSINEHPVIGDRLTLGPSALIVREVEGDRVTKVGLQLETPTPRRSFLEGLMARLRRRARRDVGS